MTIKQIPYVAGQCPMGCGELLFLGSGGHITCAYIDCPDPCAVDTLLSQPHSDSHTLWIDDEGGWTLQHPLKERLPEQGLLACPIGDTFARVLAHNSGPGTYRLTPQPDTEELLVEKTDA